MLTIPSQKHDSQLPIPKRITDRYYNIKANMSYLQKYNYNVTKQIGRGGYGVVYKAQDSANSDKQYAIKINFNTVSQELLFSEISCYDLANGYPNLPKLANVFIHNDSPHIVTEYFPHKPFVVNIDQVQTYFSSFCISDIKHYLIELLIGVKSLKSLGMYHRDIKPGNFLYNPQTKRGTLIDFGLVEIDAKVTQQLSQKVKQMKRQNHPDYQSQLTKLNTYTKLALCLQKIGIRKVGTQSYMPPESILFYKNQSYSSDIWPIGIIMLQFITRKYQIFHNLRMDFQKYPQMKNNFILAYFLQLGVLFGDKVVKECEKLGYFIQLPAGLKKVTFKQIALIDGFNDDMEDLLIKMLDLNCQSRISVENAIQHCFFDSVRDEHFANGQNICGSLLS